MQDSIMRIRRWLWLLVLLFGWNSFRNSAAGQQSASVALESFSEGAGPPLVMLGGGTLGAAEFASHAHVLASRFRVLRLQTLNIARARTRQPLPVGYSIKVESAAMTRSLDQLGLTAALDVVGHSFGALVALDFALDHPDRVRTLVLAEPPAFWVVGSEERRATADMRTMDDLLRTLGPTIEPTDNQLVRFQCALGNCGLKAPTSTEPGWVDWMSRRSALRGLSAVASHPDDISRLKSFRRPVLIVTGSSTVSFHRRINDILATYLPLAERAELPGGHSATSAAPEEFVRVVDAFLARHAY
jgi:pimeloyl-ACP methyl ester carboxylesterase